MLHKLHKITAGFIGVFVLFHLFNHTASFAGINNHIELMASFRIFYRHVFIESLLLVSVVFQILSGVYFIYSRWGNRSGFFEIAQALSGGYLAFFLLNHVGAVLLGRIFLDLNTNFWFAAAGLNITPFSLFFMPYYTLGIVAFFTHVSCAIHWAYKDRLPVRLRDQLGAVSIVSSIVFSIALVAAFSGAFYKILVPEEYAAPFRSVCLTIGC